MSFCILYDDDDDWLDSQFEDDHFDPRPPAPPQNKSTESTDEVDCVASRRPLEEGRGGGSVTSPPAPPVSSCHPLMPPPVASVMG
jgi:hypothetical protein